MGIDDLIAQMERDELEDKAATTSKLTPIDYGRLRGIAPQRVYYNIRTKKLEVELCNCGRKVIDIATADQLFGFAKPSEEEDDDDEEE